MKRRIITATLIASAVLMSSCSAPAAETETQPAQITEQTEVTAQTDSLQPVIADPTAASSTVSAPSASTVAETESESNGTVLSDQESLDFFAAHADTYLLSSGAGGWAAYLELASDGSFYYNFHDFDAGFYYICHADGQFGEVIKLDDYSYAVRVDYFDMENAEGEEWIETDTDGTQISFIASDSYGIHQGDMLIFYNAGTPVSELPEGYTVWYLMPRAMSEDNLPDPFPLAGFYNPDEDVAYIEDDYE